MLIYSPASPFLPYFRRRRLSLSKFEERRRQKEKEEEEEKTLLGASLPPRFGAKNLEAFVEGEDRVFGGEEPEVEIHTRKICSITTVHSPQILTIYLLSFYKKTLRIFLVQHGCGGGVVEQKFF